MDLRYLFPTVIGEKRSLVSKEYNNSLIDRALEIYNKNDSFSDSVFGNTKHTKNTYDVVNDKLFFPLLDEINKQVHIFAESFGSKEKYNYSNSWLNFSNKHSYQEYHNHPNCVFSCVYYVQAPKGSADLIFKSSKDNMISLKKADMNNPINWESAKYGAIERSLFIFRSDLQHRVPTGTNEDLRISIAINWK
jgi:uncharacterized protein (TIGR02466 family)